VLLCAVPAAAALKFLAPEHHTAIFAASAIAILPLAGYIGRATEILAGRLGGGLGGLLNATFGNAAELIIGALALRRGLTDLVKASLTGSIIGNVLLVFGLCAFVGGIKHPPVQRFNRTAAGLGSTMLLLSAIGLTVPAVFHFLARASGSAEDLTLDTEIAVVLLVTYVASLVFTLKTHRNLYASDRDEHSTERIGPALGMLVGATIGVAWMSELLVGSVAETARALGMSELFIGVVIVLGLYLYYLWSGLKVASRARDRQSILLVVGILAVLSFHVLYNTAMGIGLVPITGIPLPFLSYGGSFTIWSFFVTGLVLGVDFRRWVNR